MEVGSAADTNAVPTLLDTDEGEDRSRVHIKGRRLAEETRGGIWRIRWQRWDDRKNWRLIYITIVLDEDEAGRGGGTRV